MSLQPSDPAADAFERLRQEVGLLHRAIEGLAAAANNVEPVDYSPTLAELSEAVAAVNAQVTELGERSMLALAPDQLGSLFQLAAARVLARPVAALEHQQAALAQATDALRAAREAEVAKAGSWRRVGGLLGGGAVAGAILWGLLLGPVSRVLPATWGAPERLAAAALALPIRLAGERLLRRGDPDGWAAWQWVRSLPASQLRDLRRCTRRPGQAAEAVTCTVRLRRQ